MRRSLLQNVLGTAMVGILAVSAGYSANFAGFRDAVPPPALLARAGPIDRDPSTKSDNEGSSLRSFPWWAPVETFEGSGSTTTSSFDIDSFALQWRASWSCTEGTMTIIARQDDGDASGQPLADASCPSQGQGLSVDIGTFSLEVDAAADWEVAVEQQVDVPLVEPLTPEMEKGRVVATGELYDMDRRGNGTVAIYRLRDGSHMLRLEDFYVTPNVDLEIDVSAAGRPRTTEEFTRSRYEQVSMMPTTTGSINYDIPSSIDLDEWQSIVIWCEPLHLAYAGATLRPVS